MDDPSPHAPRSPAEPARGALGRAWRVGAVAGIPLYVHWTFPLLLAWVVAATLVTGAGAPAAALALAMVVSVFASVVLHELGHALVARRLGVGTLGITLLPIGGVSRLAGPAARPRHELAIALAGPLVSLALAGTLAGVAVVADAAAALGGAAHALARLAWINLLLAAFNLLPAFPLDGGRVLRAALATRWSAARATRAAAAIGQAIAVALGIAGVVASPMLAVIAVFVWVAARREALATTQQERLHGVPAARAMMTAFVALPPDAPLRAAVDQLIATAHDRFPVVTSGGVAAGVVGRDDVARGLLQLGAHAPVSAVARPAATIAPDATMDGVLAALGDADTVLVVEDGRVIGVITPEQVGELLVLDEAARWSARP